MSLSPQHHLRPSSHFTYLVSHFPPPSFLPTCGYVPLKTPRETIHSPSLPSFTLSQESPPLYPDPKTRLLLGVVRSFLVSERAGKKSWANSTAQTPWAERRRGRCTTFPAISARAHTHKSRDEAHAALQTPILSQAWSWLRSYSSFRLGLFVKPKSLPASQCVFGKEGENLRLVSPERTWKNCQSKARPCPSLLESQ